MYQILPGPSYQTFQHFQPQILRYPSGKVQLGSDHPLNSLACKSILHIQLLNHLSSDLLLNKKIFKASSHLISPYIPSNLCIPCRCLVLVFKKNNLKTVAKQRTCLEETEKPNPKGFIMGQASPERNTELEFQLKQES